MLDSRELERLHALMRDSHRDAFAASATYEDFCAAVGRTDPKNAAWLQRAHLYGHFETEKGFPGQYFLRPLCVPTARTLTDVFSSARLLGGRDTVHDVILMGEGIPSGNFVGKHELVRMPDGTVQKARNGADRKTLHAKLRDDVRARVQDNVPGGFDDLVDCVLRENGILLIAQNRRSFSQAWIAFLPGVFDLTGLLSKKDKAALDELEAEDRAAYGDLLLGDDHKWRLNPASPPSCKIRDYVQPKTVDRPGRTFIPGVRNPAL